VTGFGSGRPMSHKHGFDRIGQSMSGAVYLSGTPEQPIAIKVPWVDFGTACLSAFDTLAPLIERGKTGRGQKVEGALLRTAIAFTNATLIKQALTPVNRTPTINRGFSSAPAAIFRTTHRQAFAEVYENPVIIGDARLQRRMTASPFNPTTRSARLAASGTAATGMASKRRKSPVRSKTPGRSVQRR
jgi:crotonobetainyl-CoA:carnitine CoA-transferase CaiB-like acyl-CoA transferase